MSREEQRAFEEYVRLVEKCMNFDVDPCDDFVEYASGRYRDEDFDRTRGEWSPSYYGCGFILQCLFDNERISSPTLEKARNFYRSKHACLEGGLKEYLRSDQFNEFCGGLPAFNDNWSAENFDWAKAAGILLALQLSTILHLSMDHMDDTKVIFIYAYNYPEYIVESIDEILETTELEDDKLAEIVNDLNVFIESYPQDLGENSYRRSGLDLQDYIEIFDFKSFLEIVLCVTINNHDIVHLGEGVVQYLSFLSRLDRKVLANYLMVIALYHNSYQGADNPLDWEQTKLFKPILISAGFSTYYNKNEDKKLRYVIEKFKQSFEKDKEKFPEDFQETQIETFRTNIDMIIQYIEDHYSPSKIEAEYEDLEISPTDFHQNLVNLKNHGVPKSVQRFSSIRGDDQEITSLVLNFIDYITSHWNRPVAFYFSGQEAANWRTTISAKNNYNDDFINRYEVENKELLKILTTQVDDNADLVYDFWDEYVIASIEAIKYAYNDYKTWMRENETVVRWQDEILSRINLDSNKLFFVSFVQNLICCIASEKTTASLTLMNCEDFVKVFKCSKDSRMNPRKFL